MSLVVGIITSLADGRI